MTLLSLVLLFILSGCGSSPDKNLIGAWKVVHGGEVSSFLEFSEDRIIFRPDATTTPESGSYQLIDLQKGKFIIEIAEPGTYEYEFFFEGTFESKGKISVIQADGLGDKNAELIKVKNLEKEMKKEQEKQDEIAAKEERERKKESDKKEKAPEKPVEQSKDSKPAPQDNSLQAQYSIKANQIQEKITQQANENYPGQHDTPYGFQGQYYDDWDTLLNDIWKDLSDTMPAKEFEQLKAEQIQWIQQKEIGFDEYPDEVASSRAMGMDYLAFETEQRVYYLIEHYLK